MRHSNIKLKNFDEYCIGTPIQIEKILQSFLLQAKTLKNKSIYIQILTRLALTKTIQGKFKSAHAILDKAEKEVTPDLSIAKARIMLERGRLFLLSSQLKSALITLKKCFSFSKINKLDLYAIDAAHMIPAVVKNAKEKIKWNKIAINQANQSKNKKAKEWLVVLYQSIGLNYIETKQYKSALAAFSKSQKLAEKYALKMVILGAKIGKAKSLRLLNHFDQALEMQLTLLKEYIILSKTEFGQKETKLFFYGWICEELAELYLNKAKKYSLLSYQNLSNDKYFLKQEKSRLARMEKLIKF